MLISTSFQKNHHQKLISGVKHIFIRSGNCWVGRFCWKPRWFLKRPGVIPDAKKERTHSVPPIWQRPRWRHEPRIFYASWTLWTWTCHCSWVREHFNVSLSLCIIHVYLSCSFSLSLSRYTYIMVSCHTFRLLHALVHIFATTTRWTRFTAMKFIWSAKILLPMQKNQEGKIFHPNKNPLSGSESKKKGCTARCLILPIHRHPPTWAGWTRLEAWSPLDPWQGHRW